MTREKAVKVAHALDAIDDFKDFMDAVDRLAESVRLTPELKADLDTLMDNELARLNKVLEDLQEAVWNIVSMKLKH